jgi:hypothetical protein
MGMCNRYVSSYHPNPNVAERLNQSLKTCIIAYIGEHVNWDCHLGYFVFAFNSAYQTSLQYSPFAMVTGQEARFPGDLDSDTDHGEPLPSVESKRLHNYLYDLRQKAKVNLQEAQLRNKKWYNLRRRPSDFKPGDWVTLKMRQLSSADKQFSAGLAKRTQGVFLIHKLVTPNTVILIDEKSVKSDPRNVLDL